MTRITLSLAVEKADDNGYQGLLQIGDVQRTACRSTLPELIGWFAHHAGGVCKESPYMPPQAVTPAHSAHSSLAEQPERFPNVVTGPEDQHLDQSLLNKLQERMYGNGRAGVVALLWLTAAALSVRLGGLA